MYFAITREGGNAVDLQTDTLVGSTPKKKLNFPGARKGCRGDSLYTLKADSEKNELISRLQAELDTDTFSPDELLLASKAIDDQVAEQQLSSPECQIFSCCSVWGTRRDLPSQCLYGHDMSACPFIKTYEGRNGYC